MVVQRHIAATSRATKPSGPVAVAIAVRMVKDIRSVLLVKRAQDDECPKWVFPGGKVEAGEDVADAARRELFEETGVTARRASIIGRRIHPMSGADLVYVAVHGLSGKASRLEPTKHDMVRWVPIDDVSAMLGGSLYEKVAQFLSMEP